MAEIIEMTQHWERCNGIEDNRMVLFFCEVCNESLSLLRKKDSMSGKQQLSEWYFGVHECKKKTSEEISAARCLKEKDVPITICGSFECDDVEISVFDEKSGKIMSGTSKAIR